MSFTKTVCPITRSQFNTSAKPMPLAIAGQSQADMQPREFSTNSLGWNFSGKITVDIDGVPTVCQVGLNVTVVGSKELPKELAVQAALDLPAAAA